MADILDLMEEAEWVPARKGPGKVPSPYLPAVQKLVDGGFDPKTKLGKAFAFTLNTGTDKAKQDAELNRNVNSIRKASGQTTPPCTVLVQTGDVDRKTGDVRVTFVVREKISRPGAGNAAQPATSEAQPAA